jgi:hypothetical protein
MVDRPPVLEADEAINEPGHGPAVARSDQLTARVPDRYQLGERRNVAVVKNPHLFLEVFHDPHVVDALDVFNDDRRTRFSISK